MSFGKLILFIVLEGTEVLQGPSITLLGFCTEFRAVAKLTAHHKKNLARTWIGGKKFRNLLLKGFCFINFVIGFFGPRQSFH